jgi:UDP-N-acetylmuramate--alanine ligase
MRSLAEYLISAGYHVSGSDEQLPTTGVREMMVRGLAYHRCQHFSDPAAPSPQPVLHPQLVIHSAAIPLADPELQHARQQRIPTLPYHAALAQLLNRHRGLCIAGTHGKSTTTAMVAWLMSRNQAVMDSPATLPPSFVMGGELLDPLFDQDGETFHDTVCHRAGRAGPGEWFIAEACEYRRHFLAYRPELAAILACEPDHFDCFADEDSLIDAFSQFASRVASTGRLIVRADAPLARLAARSATAPVETFGIAQNSSEKADWQARSITWHGAGSRFELIFCGQSLGHVRLQIPGAHNVLNALAALAVTETTGIPLAQRIEALSRFRGIRRRFEWKGVWQGIHLVDDYAHHPTAIMETIKAARQIFGSRRLAIAFEPHQASRLEALLHDFANALTLADQVFVAPVFAAREGDAVRGQRLVRELASQLTTRGIATEVCGTLDHLTSAVEHKRGTMDVLLTAGAGHIDRIHHELSRRIPRSPQARRAAGSLHLDETGGAGAVFPRTT